MPPSAPPKPLPPATPPPIPTPPSEPTPPPGPGELYEDLYDTVHGALSSDRVREGVRVLFERVGQALDGAHTGSWEDDDGDGCEERGWHGSDSSTCP